MTSIDSRNRCNKLDAAWAWVQSKRFYHTVSELAAVIGPASLKWDDFIKFWGDEDALAGLFALFPDKVWKDALAPYFTKLCTAQMGGCSVDADLDLNRLISAFNPDWGTLSVPDTSYLAKVRDVVVGKVNPESYEELWSAVLYKPMSPDDLVGTVEKLLPMITETIYSNPHFVYPLCARLKPLLTLPKDHAVYIGVSKLVAMATLTWEIFRKPVKNKSEEAVKLAHRSDTDNDFVRWATLGEFVTATENLSASLKARSCCDALIAENIDWYREHADTLLQLAIHAAAGIEKKQVSSSAEYWLEGMLQAMERSKFSAATGSLTPLKLLKEEHVIVWWAKPEWLPYHPVVSGLGLSLADIVQQCSAIHTPGSMSPSNPVELPTLA